MHRNSNISLFVIIGLMIIIAVAIVYFTSDTSRGAAIENQFSGVQRINSFKGVMNIYLRNCFRDSVKDARTYFGVSDEARFKNYVLDRFNQCLDSDFVNDNEIEIHRGASQLDLLVTEKLIYVNMTYPLLVTYYDSDFSLSNFEYVIGRTTSVPILQNDSGQVQSDTAFFSADEDMRVSISRDTTIRDAEGNVLMIDTLAINGADRDEARDPISLVGDTIYSIEPHNIYFDPPIEILIKYPPEYLRSLGDHFTLAYFHPERGWVRVPTRVDVENGVMAGEFSYIP